MIRRLISRPLGSMAVAAFGATHHLVAEDFTWGTHAGRSRKFSRPTDKGKLNHTLNVGDVYGFRTVAYANGEIRAQFLLPTPEGFYNGFETTEEVGNKIYEQGDDAELPPTMRGAALMFTANDPRVSVVLSKDATLLSNSRPVEGLLAYLEVTSKVRSHHPNKVRTAVKSKKPIAILHPLLESEVARVSILLIGDGRSYLSTQFVFDILADTPTKTLGGVLAAMAKKPFGKLWDAYVQDVYDYIHPINQTYLRDALLMGVPAVNAMNRNPDFHIREVMLEGKTATRYILPAALIVADDKDPKTLGRNAAKRINAYWESQTATPAPSDAPPVKLDEVYLLVENPGTRSKKQSYRFVSAIDSANGTASLRDVNFTLGGAPDVTINARQYNELVSGNNLVRQTGKVAEYLPRTDLIAKYRNTRAKQVKPKIVLTIYKLTKFNSPPTYSYQTPDGGGSVNTIDGLIQIIRDTRELYPYLTVDWGADIEAELGVAPIYTKKAAPKAPAKIPVPIDPPESAMDRTKTVMMDNGRYMGTIPGGNIADIATDLRSIARSDELANFGKDEKANYLLDVMEAVGALESVRASGSKGVMSPQELDMAVKDLVQVAQNHVISGDPAGYRAAYSLIASKFPSAPPMVNNLVMDIVTTLMRAPGIKSMLGMAFLSLPEMRLIPAWLLCHEYLALERTDLSLALDPSDVIGRFFTTVAKNQLMGAGYVLPVIVPGTSFGSNYGALLTAALHYILCAFGGYADAAIKEFDKGSQVGVAGVEWLLDPDTTRQWKNCLLAYAGMVSKISPTSAEQFVVMTGKFDNSGAPVYDMVSIEGLTGLTGVGGHPKKQLPADSGASFDKEEMKQKLNQLEHRFRDIESKYKYPYDLADASLWAGFDSKGAIKIALGMDYKYNMSSIFQGEGVSFLRKFFSDARSLVETFAKENGLLVVGDLSQETAFKLVQRSADQDTEDPDYDPEDMPKWRSSNVGHLELTVDTTAPRNSGSDSSTVDGNYPHELLETIFEWQDNGSSLGSESMTQFMAAASKFPDSARTYSGPAYRALALDARLLDTLVTKGSIPNRELEGWTKDIALAREYSDQFLSIQAGNEPVAYAIFRTNVKPANVVFDYEAAWALPEFRSSVEFHEENGDYFTEGRDFEGSQREVVLKGVPLLLSDVVSAVATTRGSKPAKTSAESRALLRTVHSVNKPPGSELSSLRSKPSKAQLRKRMLAATDSPVSITIDMGDANEEDVNEMLGLLANIKYLCDVGASRSVFIEEGMPDDADSKDKNPSYFFDGDGATTIRSISVTGFDKSKIALSYGMKPSEIKCVGSKAVARSIPKRKQLASLMTPTLTDYSVVAVPLAELEIDPDRYQWRVNVNEEGVEMDRKVDGAWDQKKTPPLIVHEMKDGSKYVADGHHRFKVAQSNGAESVNAIVLKEADGYTIDSMRVLCGFINLRNETDYSLPMVEMAETAHIIHDKIKNLMGYKD